MSHQRERDGLGSGLFGCFSNREIGSCCCHLWHGGALKDDAQYTTINAFLAFFQSLYKCLSLFSILLLFFCLIVTKAQAKGGMEKWPEFKRPGMHWCCVWQRWGETKRRYERLGRLKLRLKSNIVEHVALCAAPLSAAGTQTTSFYCLDNQSNPHPWWLMAELRRTSLNSADVGFFTETRVVCA